ncbi:hypothetical protein [Acidimangrovimonas sediminis]|uniref:hypothetical protein n=1 Tax=Acidimangrovimonas sediminis TaxID=2056283 RepID=UPI000C8015A3|nr:hypothetical protein [Acidimangrovimonas sediminis]
MIGIVIWRCAESRRLLLWCDDNGPLAFTRGGEDIVMPSGTFPDVGDLVAFAVGHEVATFAGEEDAPARIAHTVRLIERGRFPGAGRALHEAAAAGGAGGVDARAAVPPPRVSLGALPPSGGARQGPGLGQGRAPYLRLAAGG